VKSTGQSCTWHYTAIKETAAEHTAIYTVTIVPPASCFDTGVTIEVPAGVFVDAVSHGNDLTVFGPFDYDSVAPEVTVEPQHVTDDRNPSPLLGWWLVTVTDDSLQDSYDLHTNVAGAPPLTVTAGSPSSCSWTDYTVDPIVSPPPPEGSLTYKVTPIVTFPQTTDPTCFDSGVKLVVRAGVIADKAGNTNVATATPVALRAYDHVDMTSAIEYEYPAGSLTTTASPLVFHVTLTDDSLPLQSQLNNLDPTTWLQVAPDLDSDCDNWHVQSPPFIYPSPVAPHTLVVEVTVTTTSEHCHDSGVTLSVVAGTLTDQAGNAVTPSSVTSGPYDHKGPAVSIEYSGSTTSPVGPLKLLGDFTVTITDDTLLATPYGETLMRQALSFPTADGCAWQLSFPAAEGVDNPSTSIAGSWVYTVRLTATHACFNPTLKLSVLGNKLGDALGNQNDAADSPIIYYDTTLPQIGITFGESHTSFPTTPVNADTLSSFTVTVTDNRLGTQTPPTLLLTVVPELTQTLHCGWSGFTLLNTPAISSPTASSSVSYTVTLNHGTDPCYDHGFSLQVDAFIQDEAGNSNAVFISAALTFDSKPPTATIAQVSPDNAGPTQQLPQYQVTINDDTLPVPDVNGYLVLEEDAALITVVGGTSDCQALLASSYSVSKFLDQTGTVVPHSYLVSVVFSLPSTGCYASGIQVQVNAGAFRDAAGNLNSVSDLSSPAVYFDIEKPVTTLTYTGSGPAADLTYTITVEDNDQLVVVTHAGGQLTPAPVITVTPSLSNCGTWGYSYTGSVSADGSTVTYVVTLIPQSEREAEDRTPCYDPTVSVTVAADFVSDRAANGNKQETTTVAAVAYDHTKPSVAITYSGPTIGPVVSTTLSSNTFTITVRDNALVEPAADLFDEQ